MICFLTALSSAIGRPPWPGLVWPPVWVTGAGCTHAGFTGAAPHGTCESISAFRRSPGRGDVEQSPRADDVVVHRRDERVDVGEGGHGAQPGDELDADVLAVEVAVEVQDEGLDGAPAALEGRVGADRDRGRVALLAHPAARIPEHEVP